MVIQSMTFSQVFVTDPDQTDTVPAFRNDEGADGAVWRGCSLTKIFFSIQLNRCDVDREQVEERWESGKLGRFLICTY